MWIRKRSSSSGPEEQLNAASAAAAEELCDWCGRPLSDELDEDACCESPAAGEFTNHHHQHQPRRLQKQDEEQGAADDDPPAIRKGQRPGFEEDDHRGSTTPRPPEAEGEETRASGTPEEPGGGDEKLCEKLRQIFAPTPDAILTPRQAFSRLVVAGWEEPHDELLLDRIGALFNTNSTFTRFKRGRFGLSDKAGLKSTPKTGDDHQDDHQEQEHHRIQSFHEDDEVEADGEDIICTSKNKNGWKCSQLAKPGSLLCEHHIALNRMKRRRRASSYEEQSEDSPSPQLVGDFFPLPPNILERKKKMIAPSCNSWFKRNEVAEKRKNPEKDQK